jgi:type VI secretion system protein ImpJ
MKTLTPISWTEGMFLKPHHFQQADLYQDARLGFHLRALSPFHWGVARLRVDLEALDNMLFRVLACEAVMPDGLALRYPEDAAVEERSFQDEFPAAANALEVYLAIRSLGADSGGAERFARETETRRDLLMRENEAAVEVLVPRAQLLFATGPADDRLAGLEWIKVAQVRRTGRTAPRFELSPHYVPPALTLQAGPALVRAVNEVLERLCAASRTFGQFRRERGPEAMGYGVGDFEQLLARQVINQYIPALQSALANEVAAHPYPVYGHLASLYGALTSYFPEEEAWSFPPYDHTDLGGCFGALAERIRALLERLLPVHYVELPLTREDFLFSTAIDESLFARASVWVLALHGGAGEESLRKRIETKAKVTSIADMPKLVNFADSGVPLRLLPQPPAEIPRYAGWSYFQLDTQDSRWRRIKDASTFAFHLVDAEADVEGRLFAVLSEKERGRR